MFAKSIIRSVVIFGAVLAHHAFAGALTIDEQKIDFGEMYQFAEITRTIQVWNNSNQPIRFLPVEPKRGVRLQFDTLLLEPGKTTKLRIDAQLEDRTGSETIRANFETEENGHPERYQIVLSGYVDSVLEDPNPSLDLGVQESRSPIEKSLKLQSVDPAIFVKQIVEVPDFLDAHIADDHLTIVVKAKKFDVLGMRRGVVKVALNSPLQSQAWVTVRMDLHGNVIPEQNPLNLELQRPNTIRPTRLQFVSRDKGAFSIEKVDVDEVLHITTQPTACLPVPRDDCRAYLLTLRKDQPYGPFSGKIRFELADTHKVIDIYIGGIFLSDDMKIRSLNETDDENSGAKQTRSQQTVELAQAIENAVNVQKEADPPGNGPLLKWSVANEAGIYGYVVFRSDSETGVYKRVNHPIVAARNGGNDSNASYSWRDNTAEAGKEYWYYVSIFYNTGKKVQLTGPQKVVAK